MNPWLKAHSFLIEPIDDEQPCGEDLEYEQEFILLFASVEPKSEAQYGDFTSEPEPINWGEVSAQLDKLLRRSKDIRLLVLWIRAQISMNGAQGLASGLNVLNECLQRYPETLFPLTTIEGEHDELYRANALAALNDPEGFLTEARHIYLNRSNAYRLQVRDVERSLSSPRPADAIPIANMVQQLNDLLDKNSPEFFALTHASAQVQVLQNWVNEHLSECAPDFSPLIKLLSWFDASPPVLLVKHGLYPVNPPSVALEPKPKAAKATNKGTTKTAQASELSPSAADASANDSGTDAPNDALMDNTHDEIDSDVSAPISGRLQAQQLIRQARQWFTVHEPSSPIVMLLHQAEKLVGKPFEEVFQAIPSDLVEQWRNQSEGDE